MNQEHRWGLRLNAQNLLGVMYDVGFGVLEDDKEAVKWYRKSSVQGNTEAQKELDILLKQNPQLR